MPASVQNGAMSLQLLQWITDLFKLNQPQGAPKHKNMSWVKDYKKVQDIHLDEQSLELV